MIYRFFSADDPSKGLALLKTILTTRTLRPSHITAFNDPFECKIAIDKDASDEEKRARYFKDNPGASDADCDDWLENMVSLWSLEQNSRAKLLQSVGVVCFTEDWNHHLLWSHYASRHRGFCIGFDRAVLTQWSGYTAFGDVHYSNEVPICSVFRESTASLYRKALFTKAECWAYEREVRMAFDGFEDRMMPEGAIREVIVGCRSMDGMRQFARYAEFNNVEFFQAREELREYRLTRGLFNPKIIASMTSHF